ncbi:unnamed protein product [Rhizoctonia solani]|uniref:Tet-like 2OG-Fe(II) oxygenase domain-containing protein n=1 Tax=Rhizoctonia solani TaxID=456999 RepID=A0A8H3HYU5_9AGAM|nr:unnamed protein product [Rhizoctonia solani]
MSSRLGVYRLLNDIEKKQGTSLFSVFELLPAAVEHIARTLSPIERRNGPSDDLYKQVQIYKQHLDAAIQGCEHGAELEYKPFCDYICNLAYEIKMDDDDEQLVDSFRKWNQVINEARVNQRKRKRNASLSAKNEQLRKKSIEAGLALVGHTESSAPPNVYCMDAITHRKLDLKSTNTKDIDKTSQNSQLPTTPLDTLNPTDAESSSRSNAGTPFPLPATDNPFGGGFVDSAAVEEQRFKILKTGTVYGFARAPDGSYSMVFAVQFCPLDTLSQTEQKAIDVFVDFLPKAAAHAYEVRGDGSQNTGSKHRGRLYLSGWRPGVTRGELVGEYPPQSEADKLDPTHYIDLYESQKVVNAAWIIMQGKLSPYAIGTTIGTWADTALPMFGSHSNAITSHEPSLGSNMAVSQHDENGDGFADQIHTDQHMDSLPQYHGKLFSFGQWLHVNRNGRLVEGDIIKAAIPDGLFVIPGYKVAFDLGAAGLVRAIWRGGMDAYGTTTSKVNLEHGITRWGMSIQTDRELNQRMRSGTGCVFGAYDWLDEDHKLFLQQAGSG